MKNIHSLKDQGIKENWYFMGFSVRDFLRGSHKSTPPKKKKRKFFYH